MKARTLAEMLKDKMARSPKPTAVVRTFRAIEQLPDGERAFLQHVLMQCLPHPELLTDDLPERLLELPRVLKGMNALTIGLLEIALRDRPSVDAFLSGLEPQPFL